MVKKSGSKILSIDMTAFKTEDSQLNAASPFTDDVPFRC